MTARSSARTAPLHADNLGVYGARKVHAELCRKGIGVARCTVERLMKADGLQGITRSKTRSTTSSEGAETPRPADYVERQFTAVAPNALSVTGRPDLHPHPLGVGVRRVHPRRLLEDDRGLAGLDHHAHRPRARRLEYGVVGAVACRPGRGRADSPLRPRSAG